MIADFYHFCPFSLQLVWKGTNLFVQGRERVEPVVAEVIERTKTIADTAGLPVVGTVIVNTDDG